MHAGQSGAPQWLQKPNSYTRVPHDAHAWVTKLTAGEIMYCRNNTYLLRHVFGVPSQIRYSFYLAILSIILLFIGAGNISSSSNPSFRGNPAIIMYIAIA